MTVINKFEIPTLSNPSAAEFRQWRGQATASMSSIPDYKPLYDVSYAALPGAILPIAYPVGVAGQHMRASEGILYANMYGVMRDQALATITRANVNTCMGLMYALTQEFDEVAVVDENILVTEFYNNKYPDNGSIALKDWCNRKSEILGLCPNQLPGAAHNGAMVYCLTNLLPSTFDEVCSRARTDAIPWRAIQARLIDFDKANPKAKRETNIAMNARTLALGRAAVGPILSPGAPAVPPPAAVVHAHYTDNGGDHYQFQGYCRNCNKWGHKEADCWSKKGKGKKHVKKGAPKKGKGKKGGKKGKGKK